MPSPMLAFEAPTALFRDLKVVPEEAHSILRPQRDDRYGFGYALSPYRGCAHGCRVLLREGVSPCAPWSQ